MMTKELLQLDRIEEYREGNQLEAKAAQGGMPDTLWDSYSAFANTDGGCILLGVKERDDHSLCVVGLKDAEKMKKDFWNAVNNRQKISVNLMTEQRVRIENVEGKDIIVLEVPRAERTSRPVFKGMDPRKGTYRRNNEGDSEELTFSEAEMSNTTSENMQDVDRLAIKQMIVDKLATMRQNGSKIGDKATITSKTGNKLPTRDEIVDKLADIIMFLESTTESNTAVISQLIGKSKSTTKNYLTLLISLGLVEAHGANKNRSYSKK